MTEATTSLTPFRPHYDVIHEMSQALTKAINLLNERPRTTRSRIVRYSVSGTFRFARRSLARSPPPAISRAQAWQARCRVVPAAGRSFAIRLNEYRYIPLVLVMCH